MKISSSTLILEQTSLIEFFGHADPIKLKGMSSLMVNRAVVCLFLPSASHCRDCAIRVSLLVRSALVLWNSRMAKVCCYGDDLLQRLEKNFQFFCVCYLILKKIKQCMWL